MTLSLRNKLLVLTVIPLVVVIALGTMLVVRAWNNLAAVSKAEANLKAMSSLSGLATALQAERGMSSLYLSGVATVDQMKPLRDASDQAGAAAVEAVSVLDIYDYDKAAVSDALASLGQFRTNADERSVLDRTSFQDYTTAVGSILGTMESAARVEAPGLANLLGAIVLFEDAKEYAGQTRARISSIYALDLPLLDTAIFDLINANAAIIINLKSRAVELTPELDIALAELEAQPAWTAVQDAVLDVLYKADEGGYGQDGMVFFQTATAVVDGIQAMIDLASTQADGALNESARGFRTAIATTGTVVGASVLVILVLSFGILTNVLRRLRQVSTAMGEISSGDADLTKSLEQGTDDELGALAGHFNGFVAMLRDLMDRIKAELGSLQVGVQRLSANTEETAGAVHQITSNIESLKQQTISQSASVTESSATVEQIAKNIGQLYRMVERQSEDVSTSSSSIEEMVANIQSVTANVERMGSYYDKLLGKSDAGKSAIETVVTQVKEIDAQSETLQEANSLIAGIAAQTNLLAMNAAIEAAHAGEAGSGFAVVADEIRKLAENAAAQSKNIAQNIKSIRAVIDAVVSSSGVSARTFEDILEQIRILSRLEEEVKYSMQEQSSGSSQILDSLSSINAVTSDVREAAQQMQDGSNTVLLEMRRLLQLAAELENGMTEMAAGADEIRRAAHDTNEMSAAASASVRALGDETAKFRT